MVNLQKLNLGCGSDYREGYINVDTNTSHRADLYEDVTWLKSLPDQSFNQVLAQDVLEHLPRAKSSTALQEWNRVLTVGAQLSLRVPSVIDLVTLLSESSSVDKHFELLRCLYGTQGYSGDFHLNGFTELTLRHELEDAGFRVTSISLADGWNFDVTSEKVRHAPPQPVLRIPSDGAFLAEIYQALLGRPIDDEGRDHYLHLLQTGIARESIIEVLRNSAEYRERPRNACAGVQ